MDVKFSETAVTPHQAALASRIEEVLARAAEYERRELPSRGNGPEIELRISTTHPDLTARILVYQDSVHLLANDAVDFIEMVEPKHHQTWSDAVVSAVAAILAGPLRIRVRRTLFARRGTGAIYLQYRDRGRWSGDLWACLGIGKTFIFNDWFRRRMVQP